MDITKNEALKYIRKCAKENGFTFKETNARCNNKQLYKLVDRKSGIKYIDYYSFWSAYEDSQNGYIESIKVNNLN